MPVGNAIEVGQQIRKARLDAGLTQGALADRCGTTQSWLSELENGKPRAELDLTLRVLRELGFSLHVGRVESATIGSDRTVDFDVADLVGMRRSSADKTSDGNGE